MAEGFEHRLARWCRRWVEAVARHPVAAALVLAAVTGAAALYAVRNLGVNADTKSLVAADLPFRARQRELESTFHTMEAAVLVVVDADSPLRAARSADELAERLAKRTDLFSEVTVPGGGPFFRKNGLLYLETDELEDLTDRLSAVQPFMAELARDQSLVGVAKLLKLALETEREGRSTGFDVSTALDRVSNAVEATQAGERALDPWSSALLGTSMPEESRRRVIVVRPRFDFADLFTAGPAVELIRKTAADIQLDAEHGIKVRITGDPVVNYEELFAVRSQSVRVAVISFLLFTATVSYAIRSARVVIALAASLLASLVWSNAFAALAIGSLNQISAAFNVILVGLGGELGIHFCMRYLELLSNGRTREQAILETAGTVGTSLLSSAVTTSIGLYIFLLTDFTGVGQLGAIAGTGMYLSFLSTMTVLPALLMIGKPGRVPAPARLPAIMANLERLPVRYAREVRIGAAVAGVAALALLPRVSFEYNMLKLRDPNTESIKAFEDLLSTSEHSPWTIDVITPDIDAARKLAAELEQLPTVDRAITFDDYVPKDQEEKRDILETASYFVPAVVSDAPQPAIAEQREALETLAAEAKAVTDGGGPLAESSRRLYTALTAFLARATDDDFARLQANVVGSLPEQLRDLHPMLEPDVVALDDVPANLRELMLAPNGRARVEIYPEKDVSVSENLEEFVDTVLTVAPTAAGSAVWLVEWGRVTWGAMLRALFGGIACMALFLTFLWRSAWDMVLAFFPLLLASALTAATLEIFDQPFNFANVIVIPMLIGMGVDSGVHLVHRHRTDPAARDVLLTSTARAVLYAALTTMLSFGSLGFTSHQGIAAIGRLLCVGVGMTLVCYIVVLPAVLEWDDRRRRRAAS